MASDRLTALRACSMPERAEAVEQLAGLLAAVQAELLEVVRASDLEEDWRVDGANDPIAWLMCLLRVSHRTAADWVRVAAALEHLPALRRAFGDGRLCWDLVAPATVFATADTDAELAEDLPGHTAASVASQARRHRARTADDGARTERTTSFRWRKDHEADGYRYAGFLPAEHGARLNATLEREAERLGPDAETGAWTPLAHRAALALVALADQTVADDLDPQGAQIVVHADAEVVDGRAPGNGSIDDLAVGRDSILRLLCDASVEFSLETANGRTVGIARASHAVPRWLRRRIAHRDGCCRFPGCERPIRHRHHIRWWSRGGPTDASNLVGLCWWHHHCVHEGGWTIAGDPEAELTFVSPFGRSHRSRPSPLRRDVRRRILGDPPEAPPPPP
jgi:hypothetical protein